MRPILAEAVELARRALLELQPDGVGEHLGVTAEDEYAATHRFASTLPGYRGWQWAVVVAAPPEAERATVSESALLPGPEALTPPEFVPWDRRVRPGDLAPGDLLAPQLDDPRLVPGYLVTGDPVVDEVVEELGQGRPQVLSREGREEAAERWFTEYGPDTDMARAAPSTCRQCGFFVPLAGALRAAYGVCANAMGADGRVVHVEYGCGAHSDTELPTGGGSPLYEAYDDAAVEMISVGGLRGPDPSAAESVGESADAPEAVAGVSESQGTPVVVDAAPGAGAAEGVAPVVVAAAPGAGDAGSAVGGAVPVVVDAAPGAGAAEGVAPVVVDAAPVAEGASSGAGGTASVVGDTVPTADDAAPVIDDAAPAVEADVPVVESAVSVTDDTVSTVAAAEVETAERGAEVVQPPVSEAEVAAPEVVAVPEVEVARQAAEFEAAFTQTVCYAAESDPAEPGTDAETATAQASNVDASAVETSETAASDTVGSVPPAVEEVASSVTDSAGAQEFPAPPDETAVSEDVATDVAAPADSMSPSAAQEVSETTSAAGVDEADEVDAAAHESAVDSPATAGRSGSQFAPAADERAEPDAERSTVESSEATEEVSAESGAMPSEPGASTPEYHDAWAVSAVRVEHVAEGASGASEQD